MPRNKNSSTLTHEGAAHSQQSTPRKQQHPPQKQQHQQLQQQNVSALSQQLEQVSLDRQQQLQQLPKHTSPPRRRSSKRKSKPEFVAPQVTQPGVRDVANGDLPPSAQPKPKRSPKNNKVNGVKQFSTPSKPTSIPLGTAQSSLPPSNGIPSDIAAHYAGPTFHSSPAPSSLPVPSFFASKANNAKSGLPNGLDLNSPPTNATPIKLHRLADDRDPDDSPLAPFFKADREEKARLRNKYTAEAGVGMSPTRPVSAGGIPDHRHLRPESPLMWQDASHNVNGRFAFHSRLLFLLRLIHRSFNV